MSQKKYQTGEVLKLLKTRLRVLAFVGCGFAFAAIISTDSQAKSDRGNRPVTFEFQEAGESVTATAYAGSGHASHLGVYTSSGALLGSSYHLIYTSPNGDHLYAADTETVAGIEGSVIYLVANGVFHGGTGRYANATGTFEALITADLLDGSYEASGTGVIVCPESEF